MSLVMDNGVSSVVTIVASASLAIDKTCLEIGEDVLVENQVIDKWAKVIHGNKIVADPEHPGYINRDDTL